MTPATGQLVPASKNNVTLGHPASQTRCCQNRDNTAYENNENSQIMNLCLFFKVSVRNSEVVGEKR